MEVRFTFFICFILYIVVPVCRANITCSVNYISFTCTNITSYEDFPILLPSNIRKVTLVGTEKYKDDYFPDGLFRNPTWRNISELSILFFTRVQSIGKHFLDGLVNLGFLSISTCTEIKNIDRDVFNSTPDLEALYLNENDYLRMNEIESALTGKLGKLKYLSVRGIQAFGHHVVLGDNFVRALVTKQLLFLDISRVRTLYIQSKSVQEIFSHLKYLNISYSTLLSAFDLGRPNASYLCNLEYLDLTGSTFISRYEHKLKNKTFNRNFAPNVKYVFAQNVIYPDVLMILNVRYTLEHDVLGNIKLLDFSKNNIIHLNVTFSGNYNFRTLETLNLSTNGMEYISPSFLGNCPLLKLLDLSENQLHKMQSMDEFSYLFSKNFDLLIILLQNNHLSRVPFNFLSANTNLRILDLSGNQLTYFNIDIHNAFNLTLINLRNNRIKHLPVAFIKQLKENVIQQKYAEMHSSFESYSLPNYFQDNSRIAEKYKYGYISRDRIEIEEVTKLFPQYMILNLLENPLLCDCDTLDFLTWILFTDIAISNKTTLTCMFNNKIELLNNANMEMVREHCRIVLIISIGIPLSASVIFSILTLTFAMYMRRRKARQIQDFEILKKEILHEKTQFSYVVFLSYCSRDPIVNDLILPSINAKLKEYFKTQQDLVCTGVDNFAPGMRIAEEIHRCFDESLVIVPVITPSFLESQWCQRECVDAIERHKQVLILMENHTDTSGSMEIIRSFIGQYTRASWSNVEGQVVIRPSWNDVCNAIIKLAIEHFRNYVNHKDKAAIELVRLVK